MALKMILTADINVIKLGHIFKAHVIPFSMWSDLQIRLVLVLVLQFSLKLPMITVTVTSRPGLCHIMGVCKNYIYSKKMQSGCLRSCHCHKKENVSAFECLSSRKKNIPLHNEFYFTLSREHMLHKGVKYQMAFSSFQHLVFHCIQARG